MLSIIQAAGWPIYPLILCSILALAIVIERFISLQPRKVAPPALLEEVLTLTRTSVPDQKAVDALAQHSALGEVLASGWQAVKTFPNISEPDLRATLEGQGRQVAARLEKWLTPLATVASAAPLLGLLGTVIGMIDIFGAQVPTGGGQGGNPAQLAHGISVALYNTAFGLMVAIPSLIFWRYFRSRVDNYLMTLELAADRLARQLMAQRSV